MVEWGAWNTPAKLRLTDKLTVGLGTEFDIYEAGGSLLLNKSGVHSFLSSSDGVWAQGIANFGQSDANVNAIYSFKQHKGWFYAAGRVVSSAPAPTARIYRTQNGVDWEISFQVADNEIRRLYSASDGYLYAATQTGTPKIYRSEDGVTWTLVATLAATDSYGRWFVEYAGAIFLGMVCDAGTGARIYTTTNGTTWTQAYQFTDPINSIQSMAVYDSLMYCTTDEAGPSGTGFLFSSPNGTVWTKVNTNQLAGALGDLSQSLVKFKGNYYIGAQHTSVGGAVYKSSNLASWTSVWTSGSTDEPEVYRLFPLGDRMLMGTRLITGGGRVYQTFDGTNYEKIGSDGFGDATNYKGILDFGVFLGYVYTSQRNVTTSTNYPTHPHRMKLGVNEAVVGDYDIDKETQIGTVIPKRVFEVAGAGNVVFDVSGRVVNKNVVSYAPSDNASLPVAPTRNLNFFGHSKSLANDGKIVLPGSITTNGFGTVIAGPGTHRTQFFVDNAGAATLLNNAGSVVANASTASNLCIGTAAAQTPLQVKNLLTSTVTVNVMFWYD